MSDSAAFDGATQPRGPHQPMTVGTPIYDIEGEKLGTLAEHRTEDRAIIIKRSLHRPDLHLPMDVIGGMDKDAIYLKYPKADIEGRNWGAAPPHQPMTSGAVEIARLGEASPTIPVGTQNDSPLLEHEPQPRTTEYPAP